MGTTTENPQLAHAHARVIFWAVAIAMPALACTRSAQPNAAPSASTAPSAAPTKPTQPYPHVFELRLVAEAPPAEAFPEQTGGTIRLAPEVVVSECDVRDAEALVFPPTGEAYVEITLLPDATKRFDDFASNNLGRRAAMLVDGVVVTAPAIRSPVYGGHLQVSFASEHDANDWASRAQKRMGCSGAVPRIREGY